MKKRVLSDEYEIACGRVRDAVIKTLSPGRVRHAEAVARLADELCVRFGIDPAKGRLAGIGHDIAREMKPHEMFSYIRRFRVRTSAWERSHPVTLHGPVGRDILMREHGIRDRHVLDAVAEHVLGRPGMSPLSCILYASDFLEPERGFLEEDERADMLALDLNGMVAAVAEKTFAFLGAAGKPIAPLSKKMYAYFHRRREKAK